MRILCFLFMPLWVAIDSNTMKAHKEFSPFTRRISGMGNMGVVDGDGPPGD